MSHFRLISQRLSPQQYFLQKYQAFLSLKNKMPDSVPFLAGALPKNLPAAPFDTDELTLRRLERQVDLLLVTEQ